MLKKLLIAVVFLFAGLNLAFAAVEVNKADQAALDGVKGVGPKMSKAILDERKQNGEFKNWADFESRVKGVGEKSAAKLSVAGLTVNGQSRPAPAGKSAASAKESKAAAAASAPNQVAKKDEPKK